MSELSVRQGGVELAGEASGEGPPVVLLHGLTATRRYVVMGSKTLERSGHRVIAYDARGHGHSDAAPGRAYGYEHLARDLGAVMDAAGVERAVLAGASMGAHTALRFALQHPTRVAALALITPAYQPDAPQGPAELGRWDELASGLREHGAEGFVAANHVETLPPQWQATIETVLRQRIAAHDHPLAVADALEVVPRSRPFEDMAQLGEITAPTIVVGSRDEADPGHPLAVAERYALQIPGAHLVVEDGATPPNSPIAWQGGQLSRLIAELAAR